MANYTGITCLSVIFRGDCRLIVVCCRPTTCIVCHAKLMANYTGITCLSVIFRGDCRLIVVCCRPTTCIVCHAKLMANYTEITCLSVIFKGDCRIVQCLANGAAKIVIISQIYKTIMFVIPWMPIPIPYYY